MRLQQRDPQLAMTTGSTVLESFVQQVCSLTHAEGAAIAVSEAGSLTCRASFGNAPGVGTTVGPESRFTQQCVETVQLVYCRDTTVDPRFQSMPAASFRSAIAVPIVVDGEVVGVVEVFSSEPRAFNEEDAALMQRHAAVMALLLDDADALEPAPSIPTAMRCFELRPKVLRFPSRPSESWFRAALRALGF
jgi:GAF domain-containing protein